MPKVTLIHLFFPPVSVASGQSNSWLKSGHRGRQHAYATGLCFVPHVAEERLVPDSILVQEKASTVEYCITERPNAKVSFSIV